MHRRASIQFGTPAHLAGQPIIYSLFPLTEASNGLFVNQVVYSTSPWTVIAGRLTGSWMASEEAAAAMACLRQSEEFYRAASTSTPAGAQALLYYYSFFNLIKVLLYARQLLRAPDRANHGLAVAGYSDDIGTEIDINIKATDERRFNVFDSFRQALGIVQVFGSLDVSNIALQCVVGHRLLCQSTGRAERFVPIRTGQLEFGGPRATEQYLISSVGIRRHDMERYNLDPRAFCVACKLPYEFEDRWWWVDTNGLMHAALVRHCGPINPKDNADIASTMLLLVESTRLLWHRIVTTQSPLYRRYYVYCPENGQVVIPQMLAIYALLFYFGSMNRYHPHKFSKLLSGPAGPFVHEYLNTTPLQMLYLLTSEIVQQEVVRPPVST